MLGQFFTALLSILVVILAVYIVSKHQSWFTKHRLKLISVFMILGIIIYTIGYLAKYPSEHFSSALMAIFSAGRMFVFENDISSFENEVAKYPMYGIIFGLIMTLTMLTTGMIVLSFFGYRVMCNIQLGFIRFFSKKKPVYIFTKLNEKALYLAEDIKKKNKDNIILFCVDDQKEADEDKKLEKKASETRFILVPVYNNSNIYHLCNRFKKNKINVFAISEDDNENIAFVSEIAEKIRSSKNNRPDFSFYTFFTKDEYEDVFNEDIYSGLDIHLIDENDLASRQLFDKFTLNSCFGSDNTLNVCVVGYSDISEDLYRNISYLGQSYGVKLKVILIDEDITDKTAIFFNKNSEIGKCVDFECINLKPNSLSFLEYVNNNILNINCVIIVKDYFDLAAEINRVSKQKKHQLKICVHVSDFEKNSFLFKTGLMKNMISFGATKDIYTENIIINEKLDKLAKGFHKYYSELYHDTRLWDDISLFEKQSNRALALHIQSKLNSIGLRYKEKGDTQLYDELIKDEEVLNKLSIGEHLRWNAFHFANGWRTMADISNHEKNKDANSKIHSCLVDWDELDLVGKRFHKDYKEMDRHLVRNIGNILKSEDFGIEKL